ncbi:AMP-binding protein [Persicobacter diffluens]|uniref:Long-chain-fatty-acid--CoA ligase n=1 Tax=Persicobacter diffluens TaxID=981 RepID=A0AAN4W219_9BACT|nr:long-chain-fatty-acid--CoA ligase [Persicobacter diffluens]
MNDIISQIQFSLKNYADLPALSDYQQKSMTYEEVGKTIAKLHLYFELFEINPGDKIALIGKNSGHWANIYLATLTFGAVIVPILPEFKAEDSERIIHHSDAQLLFIEDHFFDQMETAHLPQLKAIFNLSEFELLYSQKNFENLHDNYERQLKFKYPNGINVQELDFRIPEPEDLAVISYTSGTTGFSKGVMLPHRSLNGNIEFARDNMPLKSGNRIVSFLPLAHTYGCAFEFLFPFTLGCHITFLTKTPAPKIIMKAFAEIQPHLILSVPLIIEKIYKTKIVPALQKPMTAFLMKMPILKSIVHQKIKQQLMEVFGGNFKELIIGGAAFNPEAEKFFRLIKFPFTIGYGMTECGPLIGYASWDTTVLGGSGRPVDALEVKIDSPDPEHTIGEIICRGSHLMLGYYKNPEATQATIDQDGWLHTGDLGLMDAQNNILIKGRSKSMILGPSGKNIFPEEIESLLLNMPMVAEALVVDRNGKLTALVYFDHAEMEQNHLGENQIPALLQQYKKAVNQKLPGYMQIKDIKLQVEAFEKTPKRNIKRFLYQQ